MFFDVRTQKTLRLVGQYMLNPIVLRMTVLVYANLNAVAALQHRFYRAYTAVNTRVLGMFANHVVNLERKVERGGTLRQNNWSALWTENHDIVVVERCYHALDEATFLTVECDIFQHRLEFFNPFAYVVFCSVCHRSKLRCANHSLRTDVDFLPRSVV